QFLGRLRETSRARQRDERAQLPAVERLAHLRISFSHSKRTKPSIVVPGFSQGHVCSFCAASRAGRRTYDTWDESTIVVSFVSAGVLLPRPAHTKTSCVGFRETPGQMDKQWIALKS